MSERGVKLYLDDIELATKKIYKYTRGLNFEDLVKDEKTTDAVVRNFEVIGEAVSQIPQEFKDNHHNVPWSRIISMRNKMIHEYFGVDLEIIWKTIKEDLPDFYQLIRSLNKNQLF